MSKPFKGKITHWELRYFPEYHKQYPDSTGIVLVGMRDNGRIPFRSSAVQGVNFRSGMVETENSIYKLEGPGARPYAS